MKKNKYRLKNFIITAYDKFYFTWETHLAIGAKRSGNCYIIGDILLIDRCDREEAGYLILEFHEQLMKLPVWNRTRYFCFGSNLRNVKTDKRFLNYLKLKQAKEDNISTGNHKILKPGIFQLGQYKIMVEENENLSWQTYEESNKILVGRCITESGILFIGPKLYDRYESQTKKEWSDKLRLMPQWDQTFAWSHWKVLQNCHQEKEPEKSSSIARSPKNMRIGITKNIPFSKEKRPKKESCTNFLSLNLDRLKISNYHFPKWKEVWDRLLPLVIDAFLIGFHFFLLFMKRTVYWSSRIIEHFRKYRKK